MVDKTAAARLLEEMFPQKPKEPTFGERVLSGQAPQQAEMRPYNPTLREQTATLLQRGMERLGADRYKALQRAETLVGGPGSNLPLGMGFADILPFVGTTFQTQEAGRSLESAGQAAKRGDYVGAAVEGGLGALGLVPGALAVSRYARPVGNLTASALAAAPKVPGALLEAAFSGPLPGSREAQRGAIKMKGGNWLAGEVEGATESLKSKGPTTADREWILQHAENQRELGQDPTRVLQGLDAISRTEAINNWIDKKLNRYIRSEMATPEDPVRKLADQGISHIALDSAPYGTAVLRRGEAGFPKEGYATTPEGQVWEAKTDASILFDKAGEMGDPSMWGSPQAFQSYIERNPWVAKAAKEAPETPIYEMAGRTHTLGFSHLIDELKNSIRPDSDLPAHLRWKPEDLEKVTMEQAVRRVHDINQYRAQKKAEANEVLARNPATVTFKEYPTVPGSDKPNEKGLAWKEIKAPDMPAQLPEGWMMLEPKGDFIRASSQDGATVLGDDIPNLIKNIYRRHPETPGNPRTALEEALKYEGDVMGHCVGGYCDDVLSGQSKIYSLRDNKGEPLVTIEVKPNRSFLRPLDFAESAPPSLKKRIDEADAAKRVNTQAEYEELVRNSPEYQDYLSRTSPEEIVQIKGSGKKDRSQRLRIKETGYENEPDAYLLPFVQDFVRSGNWARVNDLQNTGLITPDRVLSSETRKRLEAQGVQIPKYMTEQEAKELSKQAIRASDIPTLDQSAGGMKKGGAVKKVRISDNPDTMNLELMMAGGGSPRQKLARAITSGVKSITKPAEGKSVLESLPRAPKAEPERVELTGALRPTEAPVRGQTSRELQKAQRQTLTDEQKELFERLKQSSPEFASAAKFMTPQEVGKIIANPAGVRQLETLLQVLPSAKELASVAKAGAPKQGWYRASTQAIMDVFGPDDAPRFASLLAALSPQTSVEMNLLNTLNVWKNWTAAGRPDDPAAIKRIMGASVAGTKGEESVLDAWVNNATRALSAQDPTKVTLSGPKVDSFYRNLADDVYRVTNDAWMASGLGVAQDLFSGSPTAIQIARGDPGLSPGYIGTSARMREAGQMANMLPAEAQETTWSLFMPLYETARSLGISPREVLQRGLLTPEVIRGTPDFATLLTQGKYGDILRGAGYEEQLSKLRPTPFTRSAPDLTLSEQRDLERAARRLEDLRELRGMESRSRMISLPKEGARPETAFAYGTYEAIPGRGLGHLESLIDEPLGTRQHFSSRVSGAFRDPQGRDVLQSALGLNPIATRAMTGAYRPEFEIPFQGTLREPTTGRPPMEINPGFATGVEVPVTKGMDIPERLKRELTAVEAARGYMTAQRGSPWNAQIPTGQGSSMFVPLEKKADPERMGLTAALTGGEFGLADTGAGTAVLNFGKPMSAAERAQLEGYLGGQGVATKNVSDYVDLSKAFEAGEGSGAATRQLLDIMATLPQNKREALSEAMRRPAGELADLYEKAAQTRDDKVREDLIRGLRIIQRAGLTGLGAALAAGEALAEEKPTGGLPVSP